jgi:hypothetical protein
MDVAAWLRDLGLARYEPVFRQNEVDADLLPELTNRDRSGHARAAVRAAQEAPESDRSAARKRPAVANSGTA